MDVRLSGHILVPRPLVFAPSLIVVIVVANGKATPNPQKLNIFLSPRGVFDHAPTTLRTLPDHHHLSCSPATQGPHVLFALSLILNTRTTINGSPGPQIISDVPSIPVTTTPPTSLLLDDTFRCAFPDWNLGGHLPLVLRPPRFSRNGL